jgi:hypothetical protein
MAKKTTTTTHSPKAPSKGPAPDPTITVPITTHVPAPDTVPGPDVTPARKS